MLEGRAWTDGMGNSPPWDETRCWNQAWWEKDNVAYLAKLSNRQLTVDLCSTRYATCIVSCGAAIPHESLKCKRYTKGAGFWLRPAVEVKTIWQHNRKRNCRRWVQGWEDGTSVHAGRWSFNSVELHYLNRNTVCHDVLWRFATSAHAMAEFVRWIVVIWIVVIPHEWH